METEEENSIIEEETSTKKIYGFIYIIKFPNGKFYIGLAKNYKRRWASHIHNSKNEKNTLPLYNAIRKYGIDNIKFEVIDNAKTQEELNNLEKEYIKKYNTWFFAENSNGYNMTIGGEGISGYKFTKEQLENIKNFWKENSEAREKASQKTIDYFKNNPEARNNISQKSKEYRKNNPIFDFENTKRLNDYWKDPENRIKKSENSKNFWTDVENRKKQSERTRDYFEKNPKAKEEHSKRMKKRYLDNPELKKRGKPPKPFNAYKDGNLIGQFDYQFQAKDYIKEKYDIKLTPCYVLSGKDKTTRGFTFKYIEAEDRGESSSGMSAEERDELDELDSDDED